jgi:hypothetical protein
MSGDTDDATNVRAVAVMDRPSIAERITWTSGQLSGAEVKVLAALSSFGDYETGRNCRPSHKTLVARAGSSSGTVKRALRRLLDTGQPGGAFVVARRRHRHPTTYDICLERLATQPPQAQQVAILSPPVADRSEDHFDPQPDRSEDHFDPQTRSEDQNDPQTDRAERSEDQNDPPPLQIRSEHTHTARDPQPAPGALPLLGRLSPPRCAHPNAHAWCDGRVHVPRILHFEFLDRLDTRPGESREAKATRLKQFYADTLAAIPATQVIVEDDYRFWRKAFAAAFTPPGELTRSPQDERRQARAVPPPHEPYDSPASVVKRQREEHARREQDSREAEARAAIAAMDSVTFAALQSDAEPEIAKFKGRMAPEVYAETVRRAMVRLLIERARRSA